MKRASIAKTKYDSFTTYTVKRGGKVLYTAEVPDDRHETLFNISGAQMMLYNILELENRKRSSMKEKYIGDVISVMGRGQVGQLFIDKKSRYCMDANKRNFVLHTVVVSDDKTITNIVCENGSPVAVFVQAPKTDDYYIYYDNDDTLTVSVLLMICGDYCFEDELKRAGRIKRFFHWISNKLSRI